MTQHQELQAKKIKTALWRRGELDYLLDETQKDMVHAFRTSTQRKFVFLCSRRLGKTFVLCDIACATAIQKPGTKIIYITTSFKAAKNIVQPIINGLLEDCPASVRPKYKTQDNKYVFSNGSEILLYGADRDPDSCRGQEAKLILVDEAGFVENLEYLVSSVLLPMLMMTDGRILMATTPPKSTDHTFLKFLAEAEANGASVKRTIYDCPRVTQKMLAEYMVEAGGGDSSDWKREYLCEILQDEEKSVIPEFNTQAEEEIVGEMPRPTFADLYVSMDLGFTDNTAAVFGWWDFVNARLVIEDELVIKRENTDTIARLIRRKEAALWPGHQPYKRIADNNNPQLIYDLSSLHQLPFSPALKIAGKEPMINKLRLMIKDRRIVIHPRCRNLRAQLRYCKWKGSERATFERSDNFGHYDLVDALILLANGINQARNPVPANHNVFAQHLSHLQPKNHVLSTLLPKKSSKIVRSRRF